MNKIVLCIITTLLLTTAQKSFATTTILWVSVGTNTSFNPQGAAYTKIYTFENANLILKSGYSFAPYQWGRGEGLSVVVNSTMSQDSWAIEIAATPTTPASFLEVGTYPQANRAGGISTQQPHLDLSGNGTGGNPAIGWFKILEIEKDIHGIVTKLAFDFSEQGAYPDGYLSGTTQGAFRFNSSLPIPEPSSTGLFVLSSLTLLRRKK